MGKTAFVTMTTREFALLARLEGQCRCLLKGRDGYTSNSRDALSDTLTLLARLRKPAATEGQVGYIVDLLKKGNHKPLAEQDLRALSFDRASALIDALKSGSYDPAEWDVPF